MSQTGSTPYNPTSHVWQIVRNSSGHYLIYDDTGHLRGQYRNADSLAQHLVFAFQEIDQLRMTSPLLGTAWEDDG